MCNASEEFFTKPLTDYRKFGYEKQNDEVVYDSGNIPTELFEIVSLFEADNEQPLESIKLLGNKFEINGRRFGKNKLEFVITLRNNMLQLEVVEFIHEGQGNFHKLYEILKEIQKKYKLNKIFFHAVYTQKMHEICEHYNLRLVEKYADGRADYEEP